MDFKPLGTRVIILPDEEVTKTESGLDILKPEKVLTGEVLAVGPGSSKEVMELKVGDKVHYNSNACTPVTIEEIECIIMRQSAVNVVL